jgi:hypothetical protein
MADQGAKKPEYLFNGSKFATAEECRGSQSHAREGSRMLAAGVSWCS